MLHLGSDSVTLLITLQGYSQTGWHRNVRYHVQNQNNMLSEHCNSGANPAYTPDELSYQLNITRTKLLITHSSSLSVALAAARNSGIPEDHIVLIDSQPIAAGSKLYPTVETLVQEGLKIAPTFVERRLAPGEGRTKLALLNFSSGTTGTPKAVAIPHYAVIANTIQMAFHDRAAEDYTTWEKRRTRTGDAVYAGAHNYSLALFIINFVIWYSAPYVPYAQAHLFKKVTTYHPIQMSTAFSLPYNITYSSE